MQPDQKSVKVDEELAGLDFRQLFESSPAACLVVLPDDPKYTIVATSDAYARVTGLERQQLLGRGIFEAFPDNPDDPTANGVEQLLASFRRALATRAADRMAVQRYDIELSTNGPSRFEERYWDPLNTPILDQNGKIVCIIHFVETVTERVHADQKSLDAMQQLQSSEKRFRQLAENSEFGLAIVDLAGGLSYMNRTLLEIIGYTEAEFTSGKVVWDQLTPSEFASLDREAIRELDSTGRCTPFEKAYIAKDGRHVPVLIGASLLEPVAGRREAAFFVLDLNQRMQSESDAFLVRLDDEIRPLVDAEAIIETGVRLLGEQLGVDRCSYWKSDSDGKTFLLVYEHTRAGAAGMARTRTSLDILGPDFAEAVRIHMPAVESDIWSNPRTAAHLQWFKEANIRSFIAVPRQEAGGRISLFMVQHQTPRRWLSSETVLVRLVANRCVESVERAQITRDLQASERRHRLAQKVGRIGSFEWLAKDSRVIWTPELESLFGLSEGTFEGTLDGWVKRVVLEDSGRLMEEWKHCVAVQQNEHAYQFRAILPDGTVRWLRGQAQFFYDESGAFERAIGVNIDIDAEKKARAHLQQQWQVFDSALSNTPDHNYTFDLNGRITYANRALLSTWQKPLEAVLGKNFFDLGYPTQLATLIHQQIQQVIDSKQHVKDHTAFVDAAGANKYYDYVFVPVFNAEGEVEAVAGTTRDITEQNRAAELVQEDRRRWRELLLQTPAAIAVLKGTEHEYEWVNDGYTSLVGRPAEALTGKAIRLALPEIVSQGYASMFDHVFQSGEAHVAHEAKVFLGEGVANERYVNFVCLATRNGEGEIDGTFVHATDVTDLVRARHQLEESEQRYRFLAESMPQMVWTASGEGAINYISEQASTYFKVPVNALLSSGWLYGIHPEEKTRALDLWSSCIRTNAPYENELRLRRGQDGAWRWFLVRAIPMAASEGKVMGWVGTCTDIDERKQAEVALQSANRELEEFAYVASHDLQEPLRMVGIYTHLISKGLESSDSTLRQYAKVVLQCVSRMDVLIRDVLEFSRTSHAEETPVETADLSASFTEALSLLKTRIDESGAIIKAALPLPHVRGDTQHMAHVFQNLLSNALKYRKKEAAPEIQVVSRREGDQWIISVRDYGIGFDQQYAERIFGLFKRLHKNEYAGTGLGLAICKRVVERYGGRMWAEGHTGEGATFSFALPCGREEVSQ